MNARARRIGVATVLVVGGALAGCSSEAPAGSGDDPATGLVTIETVPSEAVTQEPGSREPTADSTDGDRDQGGLTRLQEVMLPEAERRLEAAPSSRAGLIDALASKYGPGLPRGDATVIVDHLDVDWNEQAVLVARGYLGAGDPSRDELIDRLTARFGGGFTDEEATYAADRLGL